MRKVLLIVVTVLVLGVCRATAGGFNLAVGFCHWAENPVNSATWACDTDLEVALQLTVSFKLDSDMYNLLSSETVLEGQSDMAILPDWWNPACRTVARTDIIGSRFPCFNIWEGRAWNWAEVNVTGFNRIRIVVTCAVPTTNPIFFVPSVFELCNCHVNISGMRTVVADVCPGCEHGFILVLSRVTLRGAGGVYEDCVRALDNQCVSWQGTSLPCTWATPTRNATWGQVKGLYR
jgi:hypothetical protein